MATIETKFSVGDVVFRATTTQTKKTMPCPDCLGTKKWPVRSPAGKEYETACPRCSARFMSDNRLSLDYWSHDPLVECLTIGSVRTDTARDRGNEYMCTETGVGSGLIHAEDTLFASQDDAFVRAQVLAAERNADPNIVAAYDKALSLSDYQLSDATMEAAKSFEGLRRERMVVVFNDIEDCETIDDVRSVIERLRQAAE
jgi:hypothetical protein